MFQFLFKYPASVFSKGQFVFLASWPAWALGLGILAIALGLAWHVRQRRGFLKGVQPVAIWLLETLLASLILFLLWHPAISIATLRPQQNIVSVLIDDSRSMGIREDGFGFWSDVRNREVECGCANVHGPWSKIQNFWHS